MPAPAPQRRAVVVARQLGVVVLVGAALFLATSMLSPFRNYQLATVAADLCATAGLTVLVGLSGQVSLGNGAFMAVGAYAVALTLKAFGDNGIAGWWTLWVGLLVGMLAAVAAGAVVGLAAARLRGPYLAGATLAVAVVVPAVTTTFNGVFRGDQGLTVAVDPPPEALGYDFPVERWQAWVACGVALVAMVALNAATRGRFGRTMRAVRDNEVAARLAGIDVARMRVTAFVVSAAGAGLGGGLLAFLTQSASPGAFSLNLSLSLLVAIVIGGLGSLAGAVWGALLLVLLPYAANELTDGLDLSPNAAQRLHGNLPLAIFGLSLIVVALAAPGGVQAALLRLFRWFRGAPSSLALPSRGAQPSRQSPDSPQFEVQKPSSLSEPAGPEPARHTPEGSGA